MLRHDHRRMAIEDGYMLRHDHRRPPGTTLWYCICMYRRARQHGAIHCGTIPRHCVWGTHLGTSSVDNRATDCSTVLACSVGM